ncbi:MAG: nucleotidyltransferase domain-containing protein [Candidatus Dormibacteraeota bacterium]|nr:nucleotidyltransferase domain-containing protein [Candidatus Dormibacteraeota bacterium]
MKRTHAGMAINRTTDLLYRTGHDLVDASLLRVVQRLAERFGEGIRSYYLTGSYADGTAVEFSDVDLVVVAKNLTDSPDIQRVINLSAPSWPVFEKTVISTYQLTDPLYGQILVHLKGTGKLLYGESITDSIALPPIEEYQRQTMDECRRGIGMLRDADTVSLPLSYPSPHEDFYGYVRITRPRWYPPMMPRGTKELAAVVSKSATALVALKGEYVPSRIRAVELYTTLVSDEWTAFIRDVHISCRETWGYRVPEDERDRAHLRELCQTMLAFETHCLEVFEHQQGKTK